MDFATWSSGLVRQRRLIRHTATGKEIENLLAVADQSISDAVVPGLSTDAKFVCAYSAAQALAAIVLQASGYRARGLGHHQTLFKAIQFLIPEQKLLGKYLDKCREKRNTLLYEAPQQATEKQAAELLERAKEFRVVVLEWVKPHHPALLQILGAPPKTNPS